MSLSHLNNKLNYEERVEFTFFSIYCSENNSHVTSTLLFCNRSKTFSPHFPSCSALHAYVELSDAENSAMEKHSMRKMCLKKLKFVLVVSVTFLKFEDLHVTRNVLKK